MHDLLGYAAKTFSPSKPSAASRLRGGGIGMVLGLFGVHRRLGSGFGLDGVHYGPGLYVWFSG
jgi:hypothetical protein